MGGKPGPFGIIDLFRTERGGLSPRVRPEPGQESVSRSLPAILAAALPTGPGTEWAGLASKDDSSSMSLTICRAMRRRFGVPSRSALTSLLT